MITCFIWGEMARVLRWALKTRLRLLSLKFVYIRLVTGCRALARRRLHPLTNRCRHWLSASTVYFVRFRVNHYCRHWTLEALHAVLRVWAVPWPCSHVLTQHRLVSRCRLFVRCGVSFLPPFFVSYQVSRNRHTCCKRAHVYLPCSAACFALPRICM